MQIRSFIMFVCFMCDLYQLFFNYLDPLNLKYPVTCILLLFFIVDFYIKVSSFPTYSINCEANELKTV